MRTARMALFWMAFLCAATVSADPPPEPPRAVEPRVHHTPPHTARCAPTINVWIEPDVSRIPSYELAGVDERKRMPLNLVGSRPYRGDSILCSYASRAHDITTSYSLRCRNPRRDRVYRSAYFCG
jgi:hypothetical protein